jgi:hypothetical protein
MVPFFKDALNLSVRQFYQLTLKGLLRFQNWSKLFQVSRANYSG